MKDLLATTFLNMAICFYQTGQYQKSVEKATKSLEQKKTLKAFYRRGKANLARNDFENAIKDFKEAVKMDTSDPFDIQQEIMQAKAKEKEYDRKVQQKMQGFLLKDNN